jgi:putative endonuclease
LAFYVYILATQRNGTLYVGHTDSVSRRVWEHQEGGGLGFTAKYGVRASRPARPHSAVSGR